MDIIRNMFKGKDKKTLTNLAAGLSIGILILIMSNTLFKEEGKKTQNSEEATIPKNIEVNSESYEQNLENRLSSVLSEAFGVGKTKVMLTLSYGREIIVAQDTVSDTSYTKEIDREGGTREIRSESEEIRKIMINDETGKNKPLVLKEIEPKIEGVIVIAEGGDNIVIKDAIIKAAQTVLGVEPHKVQVLKMK